MIIVDVIHILILRFYYWFIQSFQLLYLWVFLGAFASGFIIPIIMASRNAMPAGKHYGRRRPAGGMEEYYDKYLGEIGDIDPKDMEEAVKAFRTDAIRGADEDE